MSCSARRWISSWKPASRSVIERAILTAIVIAVALSMLATVLPRITPSLIALGLLVLLGRVVYFYTR
jgi:hypothetical protein